jgi:lipid-A-disaccharide synthase
MLDAVKRIGDGARARLIVAPTVDRAKIERIIAGQALPVELVADARLDALSTADVAICSSGTATLEAAILGVPAVVVYRLPPLSYAVARRLVKLDHFSLVNIVAGRSVVPELVQREVQGERIARETLALLRPERWSAVREGLDEVRAKLGAGGASRRAAEKIATLVAARAASARSAR